ncbi:MAG: threonine aldolase family protein, partial [Acidimicrobiales bacterium]
DLRSDTVTRPTAAMRRAMAEAEVGDDQYGEDPTVNALEEAFAARLGKEAAVFTPSGTMANQLAIRVLTRPGDTIVAGRRQHVVCYEHGAAAANSGVGFALLDDHDGTLAPGDVLSAIEASAYHQPRVSLVALEDTHMASGGRVWPASQRDRIASTVEPAGLPIHLDGARLWHAEAATGVKVADAARHAATVMCCLSKALSAPVGSLLAGPVDVIDAARLERHRLGGAMRQAGVIAAAGLVALDGMTDRLGEDHARARRIALAVAERWPGAGLDPAEVHTNIVIFAHPDADALLAHLREHGVLAGTVAAGQIRLITHADVDDAGIDQACRALAAAP